LCPDVKSHTDRKKMAAKTSKKVYRRTKKPGL
jgi:hypothetical protein